MENKFEFMTFSLDESFDYFNGPTCTQIKEPIKHEMIVNPATSTDKRDLPETTQASSPAMYRPAFDMVSTDGIHSPQSEQNMAEIEISSNNKICLQSDLDEANKIIDNLVAEMKLKGSQTKELDIDPVLSLVLDEFLDWQETMCHGKIVAAPEISKEVAYSPVSAVNSPMTFERVEFNTGQNDIVSRALQNLDTMTASPMSQNSADLVEQQMLSPTFIPKKRGRPSKGQTAKSPKISEPPSPIGSEDLESISTNVPSNSFGISSSNVDTVSNTVTDRNTSSKDQSSYFSMVNYISQPQKSPVAQVQQFSSIRPQYVPSNSPSHPLPAISPVVQVQQFSNNSIRPQYVPSNSPSHPLPAISPVVQVQQFNNNSIRPQYVPSNSPSHPLPAISPVVQVQQFNNNSIRPQYVPSNSPSHPLPALSPVNQVQQFNSTNIRTQYVTANSSNQPLPALSPANQVPQFNSNNIQTQYATSNSSNQPLPALSPANQVQQFNSNSIRTHYVTSNSPNQPLPALSPVNQVQQFNNGIDRAQYASQNQPLPVLSPVNQTQQFGNQYNNVVQQRVRPSMVHVQVVPNSTSSNHQQRTTSIYQPAMSSQANIVHQNQPVMYSNGLRQPAVASMGQSYSNNVRAVAPGSHNIRLPSVNTLNRPRYIQMVNQSHVPNAVVASMNGVTQPRQFTAMTNRGQANVIIQGNPSFRPAMNSQMPGGHNMVVPRMNNMTQHRQFVNIPNSMHQQANQLRTVIHPSQQGANVRIAVSNQPAHLNNFSHQQTVNYRNTHPQQIIYNTNQQIVRQPTPSPALQYADNSQPLPSLTGGNSPYARSPLVSPQYMQTCNPHMVQPQTYSGPSQPAQSPPPEKVTKPKRGRKRKVKEEETNQQQPEHSNMQQAYGAGVVQQKNGSAVQNNGYPVYQQSSANYYNTYPDQAQWNGAQNSHSS